MIGEANQQYVCGEKYVFSLNGKLFQNASYVIHPKIKTFLYFVMYFWTKEEYSWKSKMFRCVDMWTGH